MQGRCHLGQAEVENLGVAAPGYEDVCGFNVAMNHAGRMGCIESIGNVDGDGEKNFCFECFVSNAMAQGDTVKKLHDDKGPPGIFADLIDGAYIGMIESRRRLCFSLEASQGLLVMDDIIGKKFESDKAVERQVLRLIDNTHSAAT